MITTQQFKTLDDLYQYYNKHLFNGKLPECIINMSRLNGTLGFFVAKLWQRENEKVHGISLNPDHLNCPDIEWHSTLVHEMCHLFQAEFGNPSRTGYHNNEWGRIMEAIGLIPSDTGQLGGKRTGQRMSHCVMENGKFYMAFGMLSDCDLENIRLLYKPNASLNTSSAHYSGKRIKYTCPCGNNVWGRNGLNIKCQDCKTPFMQIVNKKNEYIVITLNF